MPLDSSLVGTKIAPTAAEVDTRWTMGYAAAIDDALPSYMDTRRSGGVVAHPLFSVCVEWPAAGCMRHKTRAALKSEEAARGVHATHHTIIHRLVQPPECLRTTVELIGIERRKPGAYEVNRFETVDENGEPVFTTYYGSIYRNVEVNGPDRPPDVPGVPQLKSLPAKERSAIPVHIPAGAAHVYTECAHIWNPIHTDAAVAERAGLPAIILHGTATLAIAVSRIVEAEAGREPERVAEIYGRFGAIVLMPSDVVVRIQGREKCDRGDAVFFEVTTAEGGRAVRDGVVILHG